MEKKIKEETEKRGRMIDMKKTDEMRENTEIRTEDRKERCGGERRNRGINCGSGEEKRGMRQK